MGGNQLPDKFNFLGANLTAPVNKLALHDRQLRRSKMERKCRVVFFRSSPERSVKPPVQSAATSERLGPGWGCRSRSVTGVDAHPNPRWAAGHRWATSRSVLVKAVFGRAKSLGHHRSEERRVGKECRSRW